MLNWIPLFFKRHIHICKHIVYLLVIYYRFTKLQVQIQISVYLLRTHAYDIFEKFENNSNPVIHVDNVKFDKTTHIFLLVFNVFNVYFVYFYCMLLTIS